MRPANESTYIAKFISVGVLNTVVGLGTIYLCKWAVNLADTPANVIGYAVGLANSFAWNRRWTFKHSATASRTIVPFILVFLAAYLANLGTVLLVIEELAVDSYAAHAMGVVPYTVLFYVGSRWWVFRPSGA